MRIVDISILDINEIVKSLEKGNIVILPFDTAYGICVDATNKKAVEKLLGFKGNRENKPISIAVSSIEMAEDYVEINALARKLYIKYLPGPLTIISNSKREVDSNIDTNGTVGVRIPNNNTVLEIVKALKKPITATSANPSGLATPFSVEQVLNNLNEEKTNLIDIIVDSGEIELKLTSTVVDTSKGEIETIRKGMIEVQNID